jgi:hypothetical protein
MMPRRRLRLSIRPRCDDDDECCQPPSTWQHPLTVAIVTVVATGLGGIVEEWAHRRLFPRDEHDDERGPEKPAPQRRRK